MSFENWQRGYHEVKNIIHNEIGVTREDIKGVFREIAKEEIKKLVSEKSPFIYEVMREIIQEQMIYAIQEHKYPKVSGHIWDYGRGSGKVAFKEYVAGVMKEEIVQGLGTKFEVNLSIDKKDAD